MDCHTSFSVDLLFVSMAARNVGLVKQQKVDLLSTNIAYLGTDLEKNARATAAACEEQWRTAGKEA